MTPKERLGDRWKPGELLARHSSLRIGGPAKVWADVHSASELDSVTAWADAQGLAVYVVGLGSNLVFPDEGIEGVVIRFGGELASWSVKATGDEAEVHVGAGAINAHLVRGLLKQGWVGMEFLSLIPGTFGGAVVMNAGTKEKELSEILITADVWSAGPRTVVTQTTEQLGMSYRHSDLSEGDIVVSGVIAVEQGDVEAAAANMQMDKDRRNKTQPYRLASVGSTFANPEGDYAGRLIEAVGLKGHQMGGAQVSELHANFFINKEEATAADFLGLMALARKRVREEFEIDLRPEVQFVGFDGWARLAALEDEVSDA